MKIKPAHIIIHIIGWALFLYIPHFFLEMTKPATPGMHGPPHGLNLTFITFNASLIAFYYINSFILIPRLLGNRRRLYYAFIVILSMLLILTLPSLVSHLGHSHMHHDMHFEDQDDDKVIIRILFTTLLFTIIFILSTSIRLVREWYNAEQLRQQMQLEKNTAELQFLKAQINPHFFFNTLNNIYSLAIKKSESTPEAILLLADLMRYVLKDAQHDFVALEQETGYLTKFVELQKIRLTDKVRIEYTITGNTSAYLIAPLILVPFIENAFKFGISTHDQSTISVVIEVTKGLLKMRVANKLFSQTHLIDKSSGIGLVNVKRRLALLYPDRHKLQIDPDRDGQYIVELEINLS